MRILFVSLSVLCFLTLNACDSTSNDQASEITIGLAAPLTGTLARTGRDMGAAAEMAVFLTNEEIPEGLPSFRLLIEDLKVPLRVLRKRSAVLSQMKLHLSWGPTPPRIQIILFQSLMKLVSSLLLLPLPHRGYLPSLIGYSDLRSLWIF